MATALQIEEDGDGKIESVKTTTANKCMELSLKTPDNKRSTYWVTGMIFMSDILIIVDTGTHEFKIFDDTGRHLSTIRLKAQTLGVTRVGVDKVATCGAGKRVDIWSVRDKTVVAEDISFKLYHKAHGIGFSSEYYCVLHRERPSIVLCDTQGTRQNEIIVSRAFGKSFEMGWDIHMDSDSKMYIPCVQGLRGVLCMSVEGEALWISELPGQQIGITEVQGFICTVDHQNKCLHFISKMEKYYCKTTIKDNFQSEPRSVCFNDQGQFYLSYYPSFERKHVVAKYDYSLD